MPTIDRGQRLFSYAVVSDTHLNPGDAASNSPFAVNRRANNRLRYVVEDLNRRDVELVIHLGDIVHPVPSVPDLYAQSARRFFEQMQALRHPLCVIPGNHDVGDKPLAWGPAGGVRDEFLRAWSEHFGAHYFHREQRGIHFIGINAQLPGSELAMEREQKRWLEHLLDGLRDQRIFMHSHYPPYLLAECEAEHYDNLGPGPRAWLLSLLRRHRVEALFCGHVHQYWFNRHHHTACYLLPSTAFTRQDYSEMFRAGGGAEYGRDDAHKLGYMLVHIYARGHGVEVVRTGGRERRTSPADEKRAATAARVLQPPADFVNFHSRLGFNPRQDWFETVHIPPSGALDEFDRKSARNDYGLLAFLDMGVRRLRLPVADLAHPARRQRLVDLQSLGFRYRFYSFNAPDESIRAVIRDCPQLVGEWEICCAMDDIENLDPAFFRFAREHRIEAVFSPLRSKHDAAAPGQKYYHVIHHGFTLRDAAALDKWLSSAQAAAFAKYVLRLPFDESVGDAVAFAQRRFERFGKPAVIQLRLSENNPAQNLDDDAWLCRRLAEAAVSGHSHRGCEITCDAFADNDRGYFPHAGVVDRLYNPRPAMWLIRHLHFLLAGVAEGRALPRQQRDGLSVFDLSTEARGALLCLPGGAFAMSRLRAAVGSRISDASAWNRVDLISGSVTRLASWRPTGPGRETAMPFALLAE